MPVYENKDYEEVIARIRNKVIAENITMEECLSEGDIAEFEKHCKIQLPKGYHIFLERIGNGCGKMIDGFRLSSLENMEWKDLSRPYMLEEAWIWEDDGRDQAVLEEEIKTKVYQGEIELINVGCCI